MSVRVASVKYRPLEQRSLRCVWGGCGQAVLGFEQRGGRGLDADFVCGACVFSVCACVRFSPGDGFLLQSEDTSIRLTGNCGLSVRASGVCVWVFVCVVINW